MRHLSNFFNHHRKHSPMRTNLTAAIVSASLLIGCATQHVERTALTPSAFQSSSLEYLNQMRVSSPYLKVHMKNGNLYVFEWWRTDNQKSTIDGQAALYNASRESLGSDRHLIGLDSIALVETNVLHTSGSFIAITIFTGITLAVTIACMYNPKACFGSCPTFYVSDGDSLRLQAEGFSSSISPSLEATDVDALYHARPANGELSIEMKNEALETHVVRSVDVLAVPTKKNSRVFLDQHQKFWRAAKLLPPVSAIAQERDCRHALSHADGNERFSLADSSFLSTKEEIELEFDVDPGQSYGLVVGSRQTLMPTYLLYQALAYMGSDAGHWLAELERKKLSVRHSALEQHIGGIEALLPSSGNYWSVAGSIDEHGPLATDIHLISLGEISSRTCKLKLRMTKGAWRIDYVALAELTAPVSPIRIRPYSVRRDGREELEARSLLLDSARVLVTFPGDSYSLHYKLPDAQTHYEFFLESRGYYLEWIRKEWIEEQNPFFLAEMFLAPARALKRLAPEFKRVEAQMEESFWRSKYAKP